MLRNKILITITGTSGVGKSALVKNLAEIHKYHVLVQLTCRKSREGDDCPSTRCVEGGEFLREREKFAIKDESESSKRYGIPQEQLNDFLKSFNMVGVALVTFEEATGFKKLSLKQGSQFYHINVLMTFSDNYSDEMKKIKTLYSEIFNEEESPRREKFYASKYGNWNEITKSFDIHLLRNEGNIAAELKQITQHVEKVKKLIKVEAVAGIDIKKDVDLILVNSPLKDYSNSAKYNLHTLPVLGLAYIATSCSLQGFNVGVLDAEALGLRYDEIVTKIITAKPKVVGLNLLAVTYKHSIAILKKLYEKDPNIKVILGGHLCKAMPQDILYNSDIPRIDALIIGEGEEIVPEILRKISNEHKTGGGVSSIVSKFGGIIYRRVDPINANVRSSQVVPQLEIENQEAYNRSRYVNMTLNRKFFINDPWQAEDGSIEATMIGSRGCPFFCSFCGGSNTTAIAEKRLAVIDREPDSIMKEIKELYELYNCSAFRFVDELFIKESNRGIFETLKDNRQNYGNFVWDGNGSVCLIKSISDADNFFKLIKGSGCREIALGMESGNDDLLKKMNKLINRQDIKICVKFLFKHDINVKGFFMFGFPGETKEGIADTISLISCLYKMADENNRKFRISVFEFRPYPGTKVWDELVEGGKLQPTQISEMYEQVDITDSGKKSELHDRDEFAYSSNLQFGELSPENVQLIITRLMMIQKNMSSIQQRTGLNAKTELQNIYDDMEDMERGIRDGNFFQQQNKRQERQRNALYSSGSAEKIGLVFSTTLATYKSPALVQITGLRYQAIPGDGHCMYRAVTYYLGHDKDIQFLRGIVAANLESNREMYAEFIPLGEEDLPAYIARIRSTNEWAGELEINILMRLLNRPIVIVGPNNEIRNRDAISHYSGEPIFIYYDDINHYGALIVQDGHDARSILAHSLNQPNNQSTTQVANTTSSFSVQQTLH